MNIPRVFAMILAGALTGFLAGCGDDPVAPVAAPAAKPKAAAAAAAGRSDAGTAEVILIQYSYNPVAKRDPFRSPLGDPIDKGKEAPPTDICPEPLCGFDLDQLTLVAVVSGDANPVAMLEAPNHTGHIVRRNTKVGKSGGKVTQILRDCIVVTEYFQTPDGKKNPNRVNICVKKEATNDRDFDLLNNKVQE